jgi:hypothetical protein
LPATLSHVRRLFDEAPERLRQTAERAYAANQAAIDMDAAVGPLVAAMHQALVPDTKGASQWLN